jgi:tetratricopeptide (TPR) repeat protein
MGAADRDDEALSHAERCVELRENVVRLDPTNPRYRRELAVALDRIAGKKQGVEKVEVDRRAVEIARRLAEEFPNQPEDLEIYVNSQINLGRDLDDSGEASEAEAVLRSALKSAESLVGLSKSPDYRGLLAEAHYSLSLPLAKTGLHGEGEHHESLGIQMLKELVEDYPTRPSYRDSLQLALKAAIQAAEDSIDARGDGGWSFQWLVLAIAHEKLGNSAEARRWADKAAHAMAHGPEGDTPRWLVDEARKLFADDAR